MAEWPTGFKQGQDEPRKLSSPDAVNEASAQALIKALLHRFDHAAFVGMRVEVRPGTHGYTRRWRGNTHVVMGLCQDLAMTAREAQIAEEEDNRGDDGRHSEM